MGMPLPDRIAKAPDLHIGLELYYAAFWELDTCRPIGWGMGPIPWAAVKDYAQTFDLDEEQQESLFFLVRKMDNEYLKYMSKKNG